MVMSNSYMKVLENLRVVACDPFTVGIVQYTPPDSLKVSNAFFRKYGCHLNCGGCCPHFSLDYIPVDLPEFEGHYPELVPYMQSRSIPEINGKPVEILSLENPDQIIHEKAFCYYLDPDTSGCLIHEKNPYSCQAELIKFRYVNPGRGYILKAPFGRAWTTMKPATGTRGDLECTFEDWDPTQLIENDIPTLERLQAWGIHLGIETHLPEVLDALQEVAINGVPVGREIVIK